MPSSKQRISIKFNLVTLYSLVVYLAGQLVGVFTEMALGTLEMSVTSPLPLNTQPVAGMITALSSLSSEKNTNP